MAPVEPWAPPWSNWNTLAHGKHMHNTLSVHCINYYKNLCILTLINMNNSICKWLCKDTTLLVNTDHLERTGNTQDEFEYELASWNKISIRKGVSSRLGDQKTIFESPRIMCFHFAGRSDPFRSLFYLPRVPCWHSLQVPVKPLLPLGWSLNESHQRALWTFNFEISCNNMRCNDTRYNEMQSLAVADPRH